MRVKICGITCVEDALAAAEAGADAIGLNFVGGPRQIGLHAAADILRALPPLVTPVALVRLEHGLIPDEILELLGHFWVSHVQLYGPVDAGTVEVMARDGLRAVPVVAVRDEGFAAAPVWLNAAGPRPAAAVLDTYDAGLEGGTGRRFHWDWVAQARQRRELDMWPPIILAGGLTPENVDEAVHAARPYGVDVSSGVEIPGRPGHKDPERMRRFVQAARGHHYQA